MTLNYRLELSPSERRPTKYKQSHQLRVYFPQPVLTVKEEFAVFTMSSFVAECGGMGGILLGFSFLAMFEWAHKGWAKHRFAWAK